MVIQYEATEEIKEDLWVVFDYKCQSIRKEQPKCYFLIRPHTTEEILRVAVKDSWESERGD